MPIIIKYKLIDNRSRISNLVTNDKIWFNPDFVTKFKRLAPWPVGRLPSDKIICTEEFGIISIVPVDASSLWMHVMANTMNAYLKLDIATGSYLNNNLKSGMTPPVFMEEDSDNGTIEISSYDFGTDEEIVVEYDAETLKRENSKTDSKHCCSCGGKLKSPYPGIKYCPICED